MICSAALVPVVAKMVSIPLDRCSPCSRSLAAAEAIVVLAPARWLVSLVSSWWPMAKVAITHGGRVCCAWLFCLNVASELGRDYSFVLTVAYQLHMKMLQLLTVSGFMCEVKEPLAQSFTCILAPGVATIDGIRLSFSCSRTHHWQLHNITDQLSVTTQRFSMPRRGAPPPYSEIDASGPTQPDVHKIILGIDFGTTFTGISWVSTEGAHDKTLEDVHCVRDW